MVKLIEWFGVGWGVLTALSIGFVVLLAWRTHPRAAASQSAVLRSAVPQAAVPQSAVSQSSVPPPGAVKPAATAPLHGDLRPLTFEARELDLGAEVASIARDLQRQDPGRRVRFTVQQPAWVLGDHALIRMVLTDLLANAWKFTSDRDRASIEFGTRPAAEARVCCYVRDDGVGFDPAYVHKLFLPFQRLHTRGEFAGTGAGLASIRKIVERHGGRVWAQGAVGRGATFSFTLRAVPPDWSSQAPAYLP